VSIELFEDDLNFIVRKTDRLWQSFSNKTIFVTGGTGFFGVWLQLSFLQADKLLRLNARMIVLSRNKERFYSKYPFLQSNPAIKIIEGDIVDFEFPEEPIDYIIHAATEASVKLNLESPIKMFDVTVLGTKRVLDLAINKNVTSLLLTSSGAAYGVQPSNITYIEETYMGGPIPTDPGAMYGEGKRMSEALCSAYQRSHNLNVKIARCYAFVGPLLPLDSHFAAGNFLKNVLEGERIEIQGDGTPYRSYLYAADLVIWLWTILIEGKSNYIYNVGSDQAMTIEELAHLVVEISGKNTEVVVIGEKTNKPPSRYVPSIERAREELKLQVFTDIRSALSKTLSFYLQLKEKMLYRDKANQ